MKGSETRLVEYLKGASKRFVIPVYQRKYDWKEENCHQQREHDFSVFLFSFFVHRAARGCPAVRGSGSVFLFHTVPCVRQWDRSCHRYNGLPCESVYLHAALFPGGTPPRKYRQPTLRAAALGVLYVIIPRCSGLCKDNLV